MAKAPNPRSVSVDPTDGVVTLEMKRAKARARAKAFHDYVVTVYVGEDAYPFRAGDVTSHQMGKLRQQVQFQWHDQLLYLVSFVGDLVQPLDLVAQLLYLARLQAGDEVTFPQVANSLSADSDYFIDFGDDMPAPPDEAVFLDPPASGEG